MNSALKELTPAGAEPVSVTSNNKHPKTIADESITILDPGQAGGAAVAEAAPHILSLLGEHTSVIAYRPELNAITGGMASTIVLQQIIHRWFKSAGRRPFYKFIAPPTDHPLYRPGDSWSEELGLTRWQVAHALKPIATKITTGKSRAEALAGSLVIYWTSNNLTYFELNEALLLERLKDIYHQPELDNCKTDLHNCKPELSDLQLHDTEIDQRLIRNTDEDLIICDKTRAAYNHLQNHYPDLTLTAAELARLAAQKERLNGHTNEAIDKAVKRVACADPNRLLRYLEEYDPYRYKAAPTGRRKRQEAEFPAWVTTGNPPPAGPLAEIEPAPPEIEPAPEPDPAQAEVAAVRAALRATVPQPTYEAHFSLAEIEVIGDQLTIFTSGSSAAWLQAQLLPTVDRAARYATGRPLAVVVEAVAP